MFRLRLKELRENMGLSQYAFADRFGVAQSTVGSWEAGKREPNFDTMQRIADFFGVSVDYLLGREPALSKNTNSLNARDEKDIQKRLKAALGELENTQSALMFDGEPLDDETIELLIASLERTIRQAKVLAKEKYTPKKYRSKGSDTNENDPENHQ